MEMEEIQEVVDEWIEEVGQGHWEPRSMALRLSEEVGELARGVNNSFGERPRKPSEPEEESSAEIGDVLFTIVCIANSLEIDLNDSFEEIMEKYDMRDSGRHR